MPRHVERTEEHRRNPRSARPEIPSLAPRRDFPALGAPSKGSLAYLDSACLSLVPEVVLEAQREYYRDFPGCAGRSVHRWSEELSRRYERARETFARFLDASPDAALVNVRNTTEALNGVATGIDLPRGSSVLLTDREHNSNLLPWQREAERRGWRLRFLPLPDDRTFDEEAYLSELEKGIALVAFFHASNLDGRVLPARAIVEAAHDHGAQVLLDGSQAAPHEPVSLRRLGVDYYALSFHKMLGPTGTGLLALSPERAGTLPPWFVGGETVSTSSYEGHDLLPPPQRFEAGLQNYAGVLGAEAGVRYLERLGMVGSAAHLARLQERLASSLAGVDGLRVLGPREPRERGAIFAFDLEGVDPADVALFLDEGYGVLVRSGMNCVHSWYRARGLTGNVRASFHVYTDSSDLERLVAGLVELRARVPRAGAATPPGREPG